MGKLAEAFVTFLGRLHEANSTSGSQHSAEAVGQAARDLMNTYVGYKPASPEDSADAAAVTLIEGVDDLDSFAALVLSRAPSDS